VRAEPRHYVCPSVEYRELFDADGAFLPVTLSYLPHNRRRQTQNCRVSNPKRRTKNQWSISNLNAKFYKRWKQEIPGRLTIFYNNKGTNNDNLIIIVVTTTSTWETVDVPSKPNSIGFSPVVPVLTAPPSVLRCDILAKKIEICITKHEFRVLFSSQPVLVIHLLFAHIH
jgi:hypothetical protein